MHVCVYERGGREGENYRVSDQLCGKTNPREIRDFPKSPHYPSQCLLVTASLTLLGNHRLGAVPSEPIFLSKAYARHPAEALLARAPESVPPLLMSAHKL